MDYEDTMLKSLRNKGLTNELFDYSDLVESVKYYYCLSLKCATGDKKRRFIGKWTPNIKSCPICGSKSITVGTR